VWAVDIAPVRVEALVTVGRVTDAAQREDSGHASDQP
jgi:hypothetical protein